ncbi:MAG TPA: MarR family winged helix-turn-helix transcriptional regulator [Acidimicrobiales bacterium]|nr:MarR family winged helix-turn-helix transcriptional regulator [Acidimicrobiales bacterium]
MATLPEGADALALTDAVTRLRRALRAGVRTDIAWETLPMAQVELLQSLAEDAPVRVGDLAERLHLAPSTVSGLISQMLASGLVERGTDPDDRRAAVVTVAPAGREQLAAWEAANERRISAALSALPDEERDAIVGAVPALRALAARLAGASG